jgi:hypothetical protein
VPHHVGLARQDEDSHGRWLGYSRVGQGKRHQARDNREKTKLAG